MPSKSAKTIAKPNIVWSCNRGGQYLFLASPHWQVLASGNRGAGKSDALLMSYLQHVGQGWGADWRGIILRRTYPQLRDMITRCNRWIPRIFPGARYNKMEREWTFPTGEVLLLSYINTLSEYERFHGHQFSMIMFEELTTWPTGEVYEAMLSTNRSDREGIPLKVRANTNSWGPGFSWVKSRFVEHSIPFKPVGERGRERLHTPIMWNENLPFKAADPDYHVRLAEEITNEQQRKAWIENSWDIMAGGYFADVWRDAIHWIAPFDIPPGWRLDRSHDWGSSAPFANLWYAESNGEALPDGRRWPKRTLFVINEDYGCAGDPEQANWKPNVGLRLLPKEIATRVKSTETRMLESDFINHKPTPGPGDDPLWDLSRGESMAKQMADAGVIWERPIKGPNSRVSGWQAIASRLQASTKWPMEEPGLFVMHTCPHLRRTLPSLPRDEKNPDDIDCFIAGTMIETEFGQLPIEEIKVGMFVHTPIGLRKVTHSHISGFAPTMTIYLSNGKSLIATKNHRIFTNTNGFLPLSMLKCQQTLMERNTIRWLSDFFITASNIEDIQAVDTTNQVELFSQMAVPISTDRFGLMQMEKSLLDMKFTIKMEIPTTTNLGIWKCSTDQSMQGCISKNVGRPVKSEDKGMRGDSYRDHKINFVQMLKKCIEIHPYGNLRALIAASLLELNINDKKHVLKSATKPFTEQETLHGERRLLIEKNALSVKRCLATKPAEKKKQRPVVMHVDGNSGVKRVFNLTIEQAHCYYANGVLVSNSDSEDHLADALRLKIIKGLHGKVSRGVDF